jgi:hypothetical protein
MMRATRRVMVATAAALALTRVGHAAEPRRYQVIQRDAGDRAIGTVDMDDAFGLTIVSVVPDRAKWLRDLVRRTNEKLVLHVDAVPAPGEPRFAQASRMVARTDPGFAAALKDDLRRYYDLELR